MLLVLKMFQLQSNPAISNKDRIPLITLMFSVIYYQLFPTRGDFEFIDLSLHLISTPLFRTCQKQSTIQEETPNYKRPAKVGEVRQTIETLSHYSLFAVEGAAIGGQTKTTEHSKIFQCNRIC